jgi:hypothetical protein
MQNKTHSLAPLRRLFVNPIVIIATLLIITAFTPSRKNDRPDRP